MSLTTVADVGGVATGQALSADGNNDNEETRGRSTKRAAVIGSSNVEFTCGKDYTSKFTTTRIFKSRDDLVEWACEVGRLNGFKIVTFRSENGKDNKRARITLACERSGKYDRRTSKSGKNRRPQGTIKCDCPFKLQGKKLETDDDWELKVVKGIHNHSAWYSNADLLFSSRFPSDGKSRENDELKDDIQQPMEILQEDNDPSAPPLPETVSDGKSRGKDELKDDIQQLLEILQEDNDPFASPLPEIVEFAQCSSVGSPIVHLNQEGQSNEKVYHIPLKFIGACPAVLRPYILDIKDVVCDGHCGFRAIASLLGNNDEDGWVKVRRDLIKELELNSTQYAQLFKSDSSDKGINELHKALACFDRTCSDKKHQMIMPNMVHIIASCYNVVFIHLSSVQCFTFVPLGTLPLSLSSPREIAVGFLNGHFVQLLLKPGHPMPPIARDWEEYHKCEQSFTRQLHDSVRLLLTPGHLMPPIARDWERCCKREQRFIEEWTTLYSARMDHFKALQPEVFLKIDT